MYQKPLTLTGSTYHNNRIYGNFLFDSIVCRSPIINCSIFEIPKHKFLFFNFCGQRTRQALYHIVPRVLLEIKILRLKAFRYVFFLIGFCEKSRCTQTLLSLRGKVESNNWDLMKCFLKLLRFLGFLCILFLVNVYQQMYIFMCRSVSGLTPASHPADFIKADLVR